MARYDHVAAPIRKRGGRHRYWFLAWDGHCAIAAPTAHGVVDAIGPKNVEVLVRWDCEKHRFSIAELDPVEMRYRVEDDFLRPGDWQEVIPEVE
ncbi:MAG: hypothetical protein BWY79_01489 [Actinobacteria bacterium ADurb.Bin444]|nr:MAG: hypothetical protein BWY79_01489 [Actinobacteria bacterium ADurb.Bin444]